MKNKYSRKDTYFSLIDLSSIYDPSINVLLSYFIAKDIHESLKDVSKKMKKVANRYVRVATEFLATDFSSGDSRIVIVYQTQLQKLTFSYKTISKAPTYGSVFARASYDSFEGGRLIFPFCTDMMEYKLTKNKWT